MEEQSFTCLHCLGDFPPPADGWEITCPHCGVKQDLHGQFAYARAVSAFADGQDILGQLPYLKKDKKEVGFRYRYTAREKEAFDFFSEAYSAFLEAFQYDLPRWQHEHSLQMVVNIAHLFLPRQMISPLEASYWNTLMVIQTARQEDERLQEKLANRKGIGALFWRWRWQSRHDQLVKKMAELGEKVHMMEGGMKLAHPTRALRNWQKVK